MRRRKAGADARSSASRTSVLSVWTRLDHVREADAEAARQAAVVLGAHGFGHQAARRERRPEGVAAMAVVVAEPRGALARVDAGEDEVEPGPQQIRQRAPGGRAPRGLRSR